MRVQSSRPTIDTIMQPVAKTNSYGATTASVQTLNQTSTSTITSASENINTADQAIITWLPAQYESRFEIICYDISNESDFVSTPLSRNVPGLPGKTYHQGFITDVQLQG